MLTEVSPKNTELYGRMIAQAILFIALLYFIYVLVYPHGRHHLHDQVVKDWFYLTLCLGLNIGFFVRLYFTLFWVIIDDEAKTLTLKYLMLPQKNIDVHDITGYTTITIKGKSENYFGIYIYLPAGDKILLSDRIFYDYSPIERFLEQFKAKKMGEE